MGLTGAIMLASTVSGASQTTNQMSTLEEPMTLEVGISDSAAVPLLHDARRDLEYAKPRLRGWMHLACYLRALVLGTVLIISADGAWNTTAPRDSAAAVAGMFGATELYHRGSWSAATGAGLQRQDHLM